MSSSAVAIAPSEISKIVSIVSLVDRAAKTLAGAQSSAQVLDARDMAAIAYDQAKSAARLAAARSAHDDVVARIHRAQADALDIEAAAKRRLADEYDAAQERGDAQRAGGDRTSILPKQNNAPKVSDLGLTYKQIHEAREIRDAERADPGIVRRTVTQAIEDGKEPTKAKVREAIRAKVKSAPEKNGAAKQKQTYAGPKISIEADKTPESIAREGLALEESGIAQSEIPNRLKVSIQSYRMMRDIVLLADRTDLTAGDTTIVQAALALMNETLQVGPSYASVEPICDRLWGMGKGFNSRSDAERYRLNAFDKALNIISHVCGSSQEIEIPYLSAELAAKAVNEIKVAERNLRKLAARIEEIHS